MLNRKPTTPWIPFYLSPELESECRNAVRDYFGESDCVNVVVSGERAKEMNGVAYVPVTAKFGIGSMSGTVTINGECAFFSMRPIESYLRA